MQKKPTPDQLKRANRIIAAAKKFGRVGAATSRHVRAASRALPGPRSPGRKRIGTKSPLRKSSVTGKKPSPRLVARRKANNEAGYFPNPRPHRECWKIVQTYTIKGKEHKNDICFCVRDIIAQELASFLNKNARPGVEYVVKRATFGE